MTVVSCNLGDQLHIQYPTPGELLLLILTRALAACAIIAFPFLLPYICDFFHVPSKYEGISNEEVEELEKLSLAAGSSTSADTKIGMALCDGNYKPKCTINSTPSGYA